MRFTCLHIAKLVAYALFALVDFRSLIVSAKLARCVVHPETILILGLTMSYLVLMGLALVAHIADQF